LEAFVVRIVAGCRGSSEAAPSNPLRSASIRLIRVSFLCQDAANHLAAPCAGTGCGWDGCGWDGCGWQRCSPSANAPVEPQPSPLSPQRATESDGTPRRSWLLAASTQTPGLSNQRCHEVPDFSGSCLQSFVSPEGTGCFHRRAHKFSVPGWNFRGLRPAGFRGNRLQSQSTSLTLGWWTG